jgi:SAM-dependent methyltransferase
MNELKSGKDTYSSAIASAYRYIDWVLTPFIPHLHGDIVEVGIGHGSYFQKLSQYGRYVGIDIDARSVLEAQQRFPDTRFAQADILQPGFLKDLLPEKADAIVSINVLEHVADDAAALANLVDAIKPGGTLLISVPAMMGLYNDMDRLAGHHRRYHLADFHRLLAPLPVEIDRLCYFNPIGGLGWWVNRFKRHDSLNSNAINGQIEFFEKYVLPVSKLVDPLTRRFFGQSVTCIAHRL